MKLVYLICAHHKPDQLTRLIARLRGPRARFVVHVDSQASKHVYQQMSEPHRDQEDVQFIPRRKSSWGSSELLLAELDGLGSALRDGDTFDYVIFISGQDYPVQPPEVIDGALRDHYPSSLLEYAALPVEGWGDNGGLGRFESEFRFDMRQYGGSAFWALTQECAEYVDWFRESHSRFMQYFKSVRMSDELFFQTVLVNSPLSAQLTNGGIHYIDWSGPEPPAILTTKDLPKIQRSGKLFARKFDLDVDPLVLDRVDRMIESSRPPNS